MVAHPDVGSVHHVAAAQFSQVGQDLGFAQALRDREIEVAAEVRWDDPVDELVQRGVSERRQHRRLIGGARTDVAVGEGVGSGGGEWFLAGHGGGRVSL